MNKENAVTETEESRLEREQTREAYLESADTTAKRLRLIADELDAAGWTHRASLIRCAAVDAELMQDEITATAKALAEEPFMDADKLPERHWRPYRSSTSIHRRFLSLEALANRRMQMLHGTIYDSDTPLTEELVERVRERQARSAALGVGKTSSSLQLDEFKAAIEKIGEKAKPAEMVRATYSGPHRRCNRRHGCNKAAGHGGKCR